MHYFICHYPNAHRGVYSLFVQPNSLDGATNCRQLCTSIHPSPLAIEGALRHGRATLPLSSLFSCMAQRLFQANARGMRLSTHEGSERSRVCTAEYAFTCLHPRCLSMCASLCAQMCPCMGHLRSRRGRSPSRAINRHKGLKPQVTPKQSDP